jgi:hypothetical protein
MAKIRCVGVGLREGLTAGLVDWPAVYASIIKLFMVHYLSHMMCLLGLFKIKVS